MKAERVTRAVGRPKCAGTAVDMESVFVWRNTLFPSPFSLPASTTKVVVQRDSTFLSPIYLDEADIIVVVSRRAGYKSCPSQDGDWLASSSPPCVSDQRWLLLPVKRKALWLRDGPFALVTSPRLHLFLFFFVISAPLSRRSRATGDKVNQMKGEPSRDGQIRHSKKLERH